MIRLIFDRGDFLDAALTLVAEDGPQAATVAAITAQLNAPVGSFYHRFRSRDVLLGELWLRTVLDFQQGIEVAFAAGDGLAAALHTPAWVRRNLSAARLLLLYHRDDFMQGDWPDPLRARVAAHTRGARARLRKFLREQFGGADRDNIRRAQFAIAEVPVAAVRQHLHRREAPPPIVDELIRATYHAVMPRPAPCHCLERASRIPARQRPSGVETAHMGASDPTHILSPNSLAGWGPSTYARTAATKQSRSS